MLPVGRSSGRRAEARPTAPTGSLWVGLQADECFFAVGLKPDLQRRLAPCGSAFRPTNVFFAVGLKPDLRSAQAELITC